MSSHSDQYWRSQLAQTEAEYDHITQGLRDEVSRLQSRCSELMREQALHRASAAVDVRNFCQQYAAEARWRPLEQRRASRLGCSARDDVVSIPLPTLLSFLHEYSHGLLPPPDTGRKRNRSDTQSSPLQHRLHQRMLARHRLTTREEEFLDTWEDNDGAINTASRITLSPSASPPHQWPLQSAQFTDPSMAAGRSTSAANGWARLDGQAAAVPRGSGCGAMPAPSGITMAGPGSLTARRDGGGGGPVMAAFTPGLPTVSP